MEEKAPFLHLQRDPCPLSPDLASRSCVGQNMATRSSRALTQGERWTVLLPCSIPSMHVRCAPSPHRPASQCSQQGQPGEAWQGAGGRGLSMNHQNRPVCLAIPTVPDCPCPPLGRRDARNSLTLSPSCTPNGAWYMPRDVSIISISTSYAGGTRGVGDISRGSERCRCASSEARGMSVGGTAFPVAADACCGIPRGKSVGVVTREVVVSPSYNTSPTFASPKRLGFVVARCGI
jgi:hypothetical protein